MDPATVWEKGSKCPNLWVIPSFLAKFFFVAYIITNLVDVGKIVSVTQTSVKY